MSSVGTGPGTAGAAPGSDDDPVLAVLVELMRTGLRPEVLEARSVATSICWRPPGTRR